MRPGTTEPGSDQRELETRIGLQVERIERAGRDRPTLLGQSVFLGTVGVLLVAPIVAGAFLGRWLDEKMSGYTFGWTVSMIFLGVVIGAYNVYLFIRER